MFVLRNHPKGARFASLGIGLCIFALMPRETGYQDIASLRSQITAEGTTHASRNETRRQEFLYRFASGAIYQRHQSLRENTSDRLSVSRAQRRLTPRQPKLVTHDKDRIARMY